VAYYPTLDAIMYPNIQPHSEQDDPVQNSLNFRDGRQSPRHQYCIRMLLESPLSKGPILSAKSSLSEIKSFTAPKEIAQ
jgi:hypothetical protein